MSTDTQHDPFDKSSNLVTAVPEKDKRGPKEAEQSLLDRTRDLFLQVLSDGEWQSVAELKRKIQDDLARARCSLSLPWVYEDLPDKLEFGRMKLAAEAVPSLESDGLCETRGSGTHEEIRLKTASKLVKGEEKRGLSDNTGNGRCDNSSTPTEPGAAAGRSEQLESLIPLVVLYLTNGNFSCPMEDLCRELAPHFDRDECFAAFEAWEAKHKKQAAKYSDDTRRRERGLRELVEPTLRSMAQRGLCKLNGRGATAQIELDPRASRKWRITGDEMLTLHDEAFSAGFHLLEDDEVNYQDDLERAISEKLSDKWGPVIRSLMLQQVIRSVRKMRPHAVVKEREPGPGGKGMASTGDPVKEGETPVPQPVATPPAAADVAGVSEVNQSPNASVVGPNGQLIIRDPEFAALMDPHTEEEKALLEENLVKAGVCRDPLVVWKGQGILLEGHMRLELCTKHSIPLPTTEVELPDRKVSAATICRDGEHAQEIDAIAEACGPEAKQAILSGQAPFTRQEIHDLAKLPPEEQQATVKERLKTGKKPKKENALPAKTDGQHDEGETIMVPVEPQALVRVLMKKLGQKKLQEVYRAIGKVMNNQPQATSATSQGGS